MKITIDQKLVEILQAIDCEGKDVLGWSVIESGDMFQNESYCGGFDADEQAFCFSYYSPGSIEYWFQCTLDEIGQALSGELSSFEGRLAE
jgi:hypothetical protein